VSAVVNLDQGEVLLLLYSFNCIGLHIIIADTIESFATSLLSIIVSHMNERLGDAGQRELGHRRHLAAGTRPVPVPALLGPDVDEEMESMDK